MASVADFNVDRFLEGKSLALTPAGFEELRAHIIGRLIAFESAPRDFLAAGIAEVRAAIGRQERPRSTSVGVIPIRGTISHHASGDLSSMLFGGTSTEQVSADLRSMVEDESIRAIVLDIDSPGGTVAGVPELAAEILKARARKPIVSVANALSASAAFYLGSMAEASYATPSALVGSVGVFIAHQDISKAADEAGIKTTYVTAGKYKTEGNRFEPLGDDARAHLQSIVDHDLDIFIRDLARGRGVSEATVRKNYGEGRVLTAKQAKAAGMIDGIYTLEQAIARAASMTPGRKPVSEEAEEATSAEAEPSEPQADDEGAARWRLAQMRAHESLAATAGGI